MNRITAMIVFLSMLSAAPLTTLADVVVIVNPGIGLETPAEEDVQRFFWERPSHFLIRKPQWLCHRKMVVLRDHFMTKMS